MLRWARSRTLLLAVAAGLLALAGCGGNSGSAAVPGGAPAGLAAAISFLPAGADASYTFQFADWRGIEQALGLGRAPPTAQQLLGQLGTQLGRLGAPPGGSAIAEVTAIFPAPAVAWDASYEPISAGGVVNLVGFRPGFPLSSVAQRLRSCGFAAGSERGVAVYSGSIGTALNCAGPTGANVPATATTYAIDGPDHLVLTSSSPQAVSAALVNRASHAPNPVLQGLLQALLPASAISVSLGPEWCSLLSQPTTLAGKGAGPQTVAQAAHMYLPAAAYQGFGFGYTYTGSVVGGRLAFIYSDDQNATQDLVRREHTLRTGSSLITASPYTSAVTVRSGRVSGRTGILEIGPGTSGHLQLVPMLNQFDLGFARCG